MCRLCKYTICRSYFLLPMSKDHILELGALVQLLAEHMEYFFYLNEPCRPRIIGRLCFGPAQPGIMATSECPSFCSLPLFRSYFSLSDLYILPQQRPDEVQDQPVQAEGRQRDEGVGLLKARVHIALREKVSIGIQSQELVPRSHMLLVALKVCWVCSSYFSDASDT